MLEVIVPDTDQSAVLPDFASFESFEEAANATLEFLQSRYPFGLWMVTRTVQDDWIVLVAEDAGYDVAGGDVFRWSDSFCSRMVQKKGPNISPSSDDVPAYAAAPIGQAVPIKSYIGFPLTNSDGSLFGTLCAIDKNPQSSDLVKEEPLFKLLSQYLSSLLKHELSSTELEDRIAQLEDTAYHDPLTGLLNRGAWDSLIEQQEKKSRMLGEPTSVVMIDLDGLKRINDTKGHEEGDRYITLAAKCISDAARRNDVVARLGGDEFALLLESSFALDPKPLLDRIATNLHNAGVAASIGWAPRDPRHDLLAAVKAADEKMYDNKRTRKNERG
jgi:diguanylate cyclase (GGDEF)-like protein